MPNKAQVADVARLQQKVNELSAALEMERHKRRMVEQRIPGLRSSIVRLQSLVQRERAAKAEGDRSEGSPAA